MILDEIFNFIDFLIIIIRLVKEKEGEGEIEREREREKCREQLIHVL
jgi:hypothetical protein